MAYASLEPFGETRADLRAGIIASTVANAHRDRKTKPMKPSDFMPKFDYRPPSEEEVAARVRAMLRMASPDVGSQRSEVGGRRA